MKRQKVHTFGPVTETGETQTDAKEKCMARAKQALHVLVMTEELQPIKGLGDVHTVYVIPTLYGAAYGWIEGLRDLGRVITSCQSLEEAARSAIRHVADNFAGDPTKDHTVFSKSEEWVRWACNRWGLGERVAREINDDIAYMRRRRAEMIKDSARKTPLEAKLNASPAVAKKM